MQSLWQRKSPGSLPDIGAVALATINQLVIEGTLTELDSLRYTPAGIPVCMFRLSHQSSQLEADRERQVNCELPGMILGKQATLLSASKSGQAVRVTGFLAAKSLKSKQPVLHATAIEFI